MEKVVLLAEEESYSFDFSSRIQKYIFEEKKDYVHLDGISIKNFRNGEIKPKIKANVRKQDVYFIADSNKNPNQWWVELLLIEDALLSASAQKVTFVLPDMFYSRQDRKDEPHVPISARALAQSISYGLERIITMDLHSSQIQGFYPAKVPLDNLYSFPSIIKELQEKKLIENLQETVIVSPDAGGTKRAAYFAKKLQSLYPTAFCDKTRNPKTGKVEKMFLVGDVKDKNCLIIDDMIDSGGTLCEAAKLLKEKEASKLYCYGTHGLFTLGTEEIKKNFELVLTSNTHEVQDKEIHQIDVSWVFAEAIYRAQKGLSVSELFE